MNTTEARPDPPAMRAYELYVERGREDGHDVEDWIAAEPELHVVPPAPVIPDPPATSVALAESMPFRRTTRDAGRAHDSGSIEA